MVVIKKPGMFNEDKQPEFKTDIAKSLSDVNIQGNEDTVSDIPVVKKETPIDNQSSSDTVGAKIKGWEETMVAKTSPRSVRTLNPKSISWRVHEVIANYAEQPNLEYLPTIINDQLKSEHGLTDSDISSYYYAKKKSGYLDNRELSPKESEKMKKSVRVWWTTDLFWDVYEATKERIASEKTKQSSVLTSVVEESASTDEESE
ncbi:MULTISPECIES: hypothetical protein [Enterococcus]|uniref:Uncharacterized protein n=3 Tax=Enterococcus TaxID=1350 RepID=A0A4P8KCV3_ENTAV|nr:MULTISPECIES: hypothetical protein [Enterococcus]QCQ12280.1 hypothetical protein EH197_08770 [Enterococcus avium]QZO09284.1 hypothetical protein K5P74_01870 [Enterococcus raffinosus]TRZ32768.1 hypothetical protein AUF17_01185 [Enterococcus avium]